MPITYNLQAPVMFLKITHLVFVHRAGMSCIIRDRELNVDELRRTAASMSMTESLQWRLLMQSFVLILLSLCCNSNGLKHCVCKRYF